MEERRKIRWEGDRENGEWSVEGEGSGHVCGKNEACMGGGFFRLAVDSENDCCWLLALVFPGETAAVTPPQKSCPVVRRHQWCSPNPRIYLLSNVSVSSSRTDPKNMNCRSFSTANQRSELGRSSHNHSPRTFIHTQRSTTWCRTFCYYYVVFLLLLLTRNQTLFRSLCLAQSNPVHSRCCFEGRRRPSARASPAASSLAVAPAAFHSASTG